MQQQTPIKYSGWQTKGWAYYCSGDHPFFWGAAQAGLYSSFEYGNTCFTVTENGFAESDPKKFDATITNWCTKDEDLVISLACSSSPAPSSCTSGTAQADPKCPILGNPRTICQGGTTGSCVELWAEICNGTQLMYCTADPVEPEGTCIPCNSD
jgi:hypothetical protein